MRRTLMLSLVGAILAASAVAEDVDVWLTRGDQASLLEQRPALTLESGSGTHAVTININPDTRYQTIDGFGASVTDSSAWLIQYELTTAQRDALMQSLFSPDFGIGISFVRVPMGASDFALTPYTYDDMPSGQTDTDLSEFSIAHDETYIIPTLLEAQSLAGELKIVGSPWSPPAWMKNTDSLWGGSLRTEYYDEYAQYFALFLQDYAAAGVPVYAVTPQNEPLNDTTAMPAATMQTYQQSAFIGDHLGPALAAAGLDTKILAFDHNWEDYSYPIVVLNDADAGSYAAGAAFHGYAGNASQQSLFHTYHPESEIHFTEISGGEWATNFADNLMWGACDIVIDTTRNWSRSVTYWNIALDQNHGPRIGGCTNCRGMVTINTYTGNVTYEVEYCIIGHASKFVRPGAERIASDSIDGTLETVAFRNPDGSLVLIAANPQSSSQWFDAVVDGEYFAYRLTRQSVATFVWGAQPAGDFDGNGVVDFDDIDDGVAENANALFDFLGAAPPRTEDDLAATGDSAGVIDLADLAVLVEQLIGSAIGDITRDYTVDVSDLATLVPNLNTAAGYFAGDLNGDQLVDMNDVAILQQHASQP